MILVARRKDKLEALAKDLGESAQIISCDVSTPEACTELYKKTRGKVDFLVNNAGFGVFGPAWETDIKEELQLLRTNIEAPHILTKLFLADFVARNEGRILNICSAAAFAPGPNMAAYYASKAYLLHFSEAVSEELRHRGSRATVTAFCPGPLKTEFDRKAHTRFHMPYMRSEKAAECAVDAAVLGVSVCTPGIANKAGKALAKLAPDGLVRKVAYYLQSDQ